ncbi:MAG: helix-turn-helix domain-containing protein [Bdellovibrio sp.]
MKNSAPELVSEIKQIYAQYIAEVGSGGYKVWPKSIRDRALLLTDVVGSCKKAADLSGLSVETIYQWRAEVKKSQFKSLAVVERPSAAVTVTATNSV